MVHGFLCPLFRSGAFGLLTAQFHHKKHASIRRDAEQGGDTGLEYFVSNESEH
jgi:hypothetical protein